MARDVGELRGGLKFLQQATAVMANMALDGMGASTQKQANYGHGKKGRLTRGELSASEEQATTIMANKGQDRMRATMTRAVLQKGMSM